MENQKVLENINSIKENINKSSIETIDANLNEKKTLKLLQFLKDNLWKNLLLH